MKTSFHYGLQPRRWRVRRVGALLAFALAGCSGFELGGTCPTGNGLQAEDLNGRDEAKKNLAFIFDGGPAEATREIADVMSAYSAPATFFVEGENVSAYATDLTRLKATGHLIGNRGYSQGVLGDAIDPVAAVAKTDELIAPYVSGDVFLLRVSGKLANATRQRLLEGGLGRYVGPIAADTGETSAGQVLTDACLVAGQSAVDCSQRYIEAIRQVDHGIIALGGVTSDTVSLLKDLMPRLTDEGFHFERLDSVGVVSAALVSVGAKPGTAGGAPGCQEYRR